MKDPYTTLGVSKDASIEDIKKAYKKLALEWHPDRHQGDKEAEERFKEINEAYNLVKDGKYNPFANGHASIDPFSGIGDFFSQIFGFGRSQNHSPPKRVKTTNMTITMEEAHTGCNKKIKYKEVNVCTKCKGIGFELTNEPCKSCNGSGQIRSAVGAGNIHIARTCHVCKGFGRTMGPACSSCAGTGKIETERVLDVVIPAGILHGQKIRPSSDLEITIFYFPHPQFKLLDRMSGKISSNVSISMFDAILGKNVEIETLDGKKTLKIIPGTQPGSILRIKNGGVGKRTDHLINVEVKLPEKLNEQQIKLLQKLQKTIGE